MQCAMRALTITRYGGPEVLEIRETPTPEPGPGEVRVRVERAGLAYSDLTARIGMYPDAPKAPCVVGYEVSGTVDALGAGVGGLHRGQRVMGITHFGGQASHAIIPERRVLPIGDEVDFDTAAALSVNYLTAFHILFEVHRLREGDSVLVHMASGGLGIALAQLARTVPGVVLYGAASKAKHEALREHGYAHLVDYRDTDVCAEVRRLTGDRGVRLVVDPLGPSSWRKSLGALQPVGHLCVCGWAEVLHEGRRNLWNLATQAVQMPLLTPMGLMRQNRMVSGVNMGGLWEEEALLRRHLSAILEHVKSGAAKPPIDRVFPLSEGPAAHRYMQERRHVGKVLFDCQA